MAGPAAFALVPFFTALGKFLLGAIIGKMVFAVIVNSIILGASFLFYKNFALASVEYAISFFEFFGFGGLVSQIQHYYNQLPPIIVQVLAYFEAGALLGLLVNGYISTIFLAWVLRKFS